ncbi:XF1762 family protein [Streptomonospora arabica]|uniref:XF1762 family protein n=1 Tax=Streptomonospora arabica TaxID=412417 RepID=A0ABV9SG96_9ACTN
MSLHLSPVSLAEAKAFIEVFHRHLGPPRGHKFSLGAADQAGVLVAVAVVGRPVARGLDDGRSLEVTRLASDGTPNACSLLYAACRRAARALAYERLVTYTRADEPGTSLRAAGWRPVAGLPPRGDWHPPRRDGARGPARTRWEAP